MTQAFSYVRWSHPSQSTGDSLRRQSEAAEHYAAEHGLSLDTSHLDRGVSSYHGRNAKTGALRRFLDAIKTGAIQPGAHLLIENLDRLSRQDVLDGYDVFRDIVKAGVIIVTLQDRLIYSRQTISANSGVLVMALILLTRGHEESRTKGLRVGEARRKAKQAARESLLRWTRKGPSWSCLEDGVFQVIPERVRGVRRAFDLAEEGFAIRDIAIKLNAEAHPAPTSQGWTREGVAKLLASRKVLGEYQPTCVNGANGERTHDGPAVPGYYPVIISPDQFRRVREKIEAVSRRKGPNGPPRVGNLFQGISRCGTCGGVMGMHISVATRDGRHAALRCNTAHSGRPAIDGQPCSNRRRIKYSYVEETMLSYIAELDVTPQDIRSDDEVRLEALQSEARDLEKRSERLLDLIEAGDKRAIGRQLANSARLREIETEGESLRRKIGLEIGDADQESRKRDLIGMIEALKADDYEGQYDLRCRIALAFRSVVESLRFDPSGHWFVQMRSGRRYAFVAWKVAEHIRAQGLPVGPGMRFDPTTENAIGRKASILPPAAVLNLTADVKPAAAAPPRRQRRKPPAPGTEPDAAPPAKRTLRARP